MTIDRRTVLAGAAAAAAVTALPAGGPAFAAAPPVGTQAPGFYRYKLGAFEITAVTDGVARRPLDDKFVRNAPFDDVKAALTEAFMPTDSLTIPFTAMVVNNGSKLVLIDTGFADNGGPTNGMIGRNLAAAGIDPKQIDVVLISHFHGDHIQGVRTKAGALVYPNAEIMVPEPEWAFWMDDARMNQVPEAQRGGFQGARRVFAPNARDVKQFKWGQEPVTGITAVEAKGHTPGHTAFAISSGDAKLMVMSDTINHPALFLRNPDWSPIFDMDADTARATRRKLFDMAAAERMQIAGYHIPFPATGHVVKDGNRYRLQPVNWMPSA